MRFLIDLPTEICLALERAAVEAKASGQFSNKKAGGKKAMAEKILIDWANASEKENVWSDPKPREVLKLPRRKPEAARPEQRRSEKNADKRHDLP